MPDVTVSLSNEEHDDLKSIADSRSQSTEEAAHDLLVDAISAEITSEPACKSSCFQSRREP